MAYHDLTRAQEEAIIAKQDRATAEAVSLASQWGAGEWRLLGEVIRLIGADYAADIIHDSTAPEFMKLKRQLGIRSRH